MNLQNIGTWAMAGLTGVLTAEQTAANEPGATKLQKATDITISEAQLAGQMVSDKAKPIVACGCNLIVAALNLFGVFQHKSTPAAPAAPAK